MFTFEGDVDGVDTSTIAVFKAQLAITADIMVPGSIARAPQLLNDVTTHNILGPYEATDANTKTANCCMAAYTPF
jgi:hypothetical protein